MDQKNGDDRPESVSFSVAAVVLLAVPLLWTLDVNDTHFWPRKTCCCGNDGTDEIMVDKFRMLQLRPLVLQINLVLDVTNEEQDKGHIDVSNCNSNVVAKQG
jgi:hypothetical protein